MATADHPDVKIIEASTESLKDIPLECDLCNRKFNKMAYYKSHYIRVHNKCIVVMPLKNEKEDKTEKKRKNNKRLKPRTGSVKETSIEAKNMTNTDTQLKNKKVNAKSGKRKEVNLANQSDKEGETVNVPKKIKEEQFICEMCKEVFYSSLDLEKHALLHVQESEDKHAGTTDEDKPIACAECGERFALESAYNNHKLRHTIKCDRCDELLNPLELNFLNTHVCSGEVYDEFSECDICGKSFKQYYYLKVHRRVKHGLYDKLL